MFILMIISYGLLTLKRNFFRYETQGTNTEKYKELLKDFSWRFNFVNDNIL